MLEGRTGESGFVYKQTHVAFDLENDRFKSTVPVFKSDRFSGITGMPSAPAYPFHSFIYRVVLEIYITFSRWEKLMNERVFV